MEKNITFTSLIRPIKSNLFYDIAFGMPKKNSVNYPWTVSQSVCAPQAYTTGVIDCTMCGITDGKDVFMMHICPTRKENSNFTTIKQFLLNKINFNNKDLSALVVGGRYYPHSNNSYKLFDNIVNFLKSKKVPTTTLKGKDIYEGVDILYRQQNDEWLISSKYLDNFINKEAPGVVLKKMFPEINVSDCDIIMS